MKSPPIQATQFLGLAYEYILAVTMRPWIGEAGLYYGLGSNFEPEVNGKKESLNSYGTRLSLKIPFTIGEFDQLFIQPAWQFLNFSATDYNLSVSQLSFSAGLRF